MHASSQKNWCYNFLVMYKQVAKGNLRYQLTCYSNFIHVLKGQKYEYHAQMEINS